MGVEDFKFIAGSRFKSVHDACVSYELEVFFAYSWLTMFHVKIDI